MGYDDIKKHGFDKRTAEERQELARIAGKASGEARRRKADFRKTLNLLLTAKIDSPEWTPFLKELGLDSTLESAVNGAMIKEALEGNVKAFIAIRDTLGETTKSDMDLAEQQVRIDKTKAEMEKVNAETDRARGSADEVEYLDDLDEEIYGDG